MKNKLFTMITMGAMAVTLLVGCGVQTAGIVIPEVVETEVEITAGAGDYITVSENYTEIGTTTDLDQAKETVANFFAENFMGCVMNSLEYDDTYSAEEYKQIAASYGADEAVIFTSDFYVPEDCENMVLNPGMTYEYYTYTLTRNVGGEWVIQTCGMQ